MKKILIIGSNSFTGSHLVKFCLDHDYKVVGISRSDEYPEIMLPYRYGFKPQEFNFYKLDINKEIKKIIEVSDSFRPEIIANFAAQGEVRNSWKYPDQWFQTNCLSVVKLSDELRKKDYIKRYVTASTPEVYGNTEDNVEENHIYLPSTPYAASKLAGDLHLYTLFKRYGFPVVFTRAANVFGIHQQLYRIIPRTIIYLKMGKKIELHGKGKAKRAFIHVRDVAEATMNIAEKGLSGEVYHLSPEEDEISIYDLVKIICKMMDYKFEESVNLIDQNFGQDAKFSLSSRKIREEIGWSQSVTLEEGIQETIIWIEKNWNKISQMPLEYVHLA